MAKRGNLGSVGGGVKDGGVAAGWIAHPDVRITATAPYEAGQRIPPKVKSAQANCAAKGGKKI